MPIFGNFTEMPLPDVISLIGHSTGKFDVWRYSAQHHYELYLHDGQITLVRFNEEELIDSIQTKSFIKDLVQANEGDFEFFRGEAVSGPHSFPVDELLLSGLTEADEMMLYRKHFSEPDTIFGLTGAPQAWLDDDLSEFWRASKPFFDKGASARDLFNNLGLYLDQILLKIYKLRNAGMIETHRAGAESSQVEDQFLDGKSVTETIWLEKDTDDDESILPESLGSAFKHSWEEKEFDTGDTFAGAGQVSGKESDSRSKAGVKLGSVNLFEANENTLNDLMRSVQSAMGNKK